MNVSTLHPPPPPTHIKTDHSENLPTCQAPTCYSRIPVVGTIPFPPPQPTPHSGNMQGYNPEKSRSRWQIGFAMLGVFKRPLGHFDGPWRVRFWALPLLERGQPKHHLPRATKRQQSTKPGVPLDSGDWKRETWSSPCRLRWNSVLSRVRGRSINLAPFWQRP